MSPEVGRRHPPFQSLSVKVSSKDNATSFRPNRNFDAGQLCSQHLQAVAWGEIAINISCLNARGPNMAIAFPFLGQGRLGSASEPYGAVASAIRISVLVVHVVRLLVY